MTTLIVLSLVFSISLFTIRIKKGEYQYALAARIAMSAMLFFTAVSHFVYTEGMEMMIPDFVPYKQEVVYFTGIIEISAAIGLLTPRLRTLTGWLLILFFILIIPANIKSSLEHIDLKSATNTGNGMLYLWFRIPLQILFIAWTYMSAIKPVK